MSINTAHLRRLRELDPFDKTYSIGYEVGHKDWSPYPRVNHCEKAFLEREYLIDVERFRNITQAYKENERATTKSDAPEHLKNINECHPQNLR